MSDQAIMVIIYLQIYFINLNFPEKIDLKYFWNGSLNWIAYHTHRKLFSVRYESFQIIICLKIKWLAYLAKMIEIFLTVVLLEPYISGFQ